MSSKMINIGLDYDGTYTADPTLWDRFIDMAYLLGHEVYLVTSRPAEESDEVYKALADKIPVRNFFYTGGIAKEDYVQNADNIKIDIWIDNEPEFITENKY
jgi:acid phosphatase class B